MYVLPLKQYRELLIYDAVQMGKQSIARHLAVYREFGAL